MVFAAGLGTRLRPLTNDKPKALIEIKGHTLLQIVILNLKKYGFNDIIVNVHHFADMIIDYLKANDNFGANIIISDERDRLLDTGGGLKKAQKYFGDEPFLLHNVDIISDLNLNMLYDHHLKENAVVTLAVRNRKTSRYFLFDTEHCLCGWKNFKTNETILCKAPSSKIIPYAFSGIQVVSPVIFNYMDINGAFSIKDVYIKIALTRKISAFIHDDSIWLDIGKPENIVPAENIIDKIV